MPRTTKSCVCGGACLGSYLPPPVEYTLTFMQPNDDHIPADEDGMATLHLLNAVLLRVCRTVFWIRIVFCPAVNILGCPVSASGVLIVFRLNGVIRLLVLAPVCWRTQVTLAVLAVLMWLGLRRGARETGSVHLARRPSPPPKLPRCTTSWHGIVGLLYRTNLADSAIPCTPGDPEFANSRCGESCPTTVRAALQTVAVCRGSRGAGGADSARRCHGVAALQRVRALAPL